MATDPALTELTPDISKFDSHTRFMLAYGVMTAGYGLVYLFRTKDRTNRRWKALSLAARVKEGNEINELEAAHRDLEHALLRPLKLAWPFSMASGRVARTRNRLLVASEGLIAAARSTQKV
jgi:hypothetical protein